MRKCCKISLKIQKSADTVSRFRGLPGENQAEREKKTDRKKQMGSICFVTLHK